MNKILSSPASSLSTNNRNNCKGKPKWGASCILYSEYINPVWAVPNSKVKELKRIWEKLEVVFKQLIFPESGYRGTILTGENENWYCYRGFVIHKKGNICEMRLDKYGEIENKILNAAPDEVLKDVCGFL